MSENSHGMGVKRLMSEIFARTELMLGEAAMEKLRKSRVIIFGVGGVGGYALEGLIRSGIYRIDLVDGDTVSKSNINRQIIATANTVGMPKVEAAKERALSINPDANINIFNLFYCEETKEKINLENYDYVIDCIDTVSSKIMLIEEAYNKKIKIISSMGAGNKLDPTRFEVSDIHKTSVCPLARVIRQKAKQLGIKKLKVVYSKEEPLKRVVEDESSARHAPGSVAFIPSVVGLIIAGEVVKDLIK